MKSTKSFAPIILFVYNRPWHTQQTIEALQKNDLAGQSDLIIYSDAPKAEQNQHSVNDVRKYLRTITGFNSVKIIERHKNWGLAANIIDGVTDVVNKFGKVIVLEDDIVVSPSFLQFMNQALNFYQKFNKVWHIGAWNYPLEFRDIGDSYFWRVMNCWGWATWADRWIHFEKNPHKLIREWSTQKKRHFDLDNSGIFWPQITGNFEGKINTWAIFWYATIYENNGLCLNPTQSYVENIGHDGSGTHCGHGQINNIPKPILCSKNEFDWPILVEESTLAINRIKNHYKLQKLFLIRAINKLARVIIGKNII